MFPPDIPLSPPHKVFRTENIIDLRELARCGTGAEVMWLLVPVYVAGEKTPTQGNTDEPLTRIEFAQTALVEALS